ANWRVTDCSSIAAVAAAVGGRVAGTERVSAAGVLLIRSDCVNYFTMLSNPARVKGRTPSRGVSDTSRAAKADGDRAVFDDHRHGATSFRVAEHPFERRRVFLDVHVIERNMPPRIVVPGGSRIGS